MSDPPRDAWLGGLTCLAIALAGCHEPPPAAPPPAPPGPLRGPFALTYYWIAVEPAHAPTRDVTLYASQDGRCEAVARVSKAFAHEIESSGTARLADGRVVGVEGPCRCARSPCIEVIADGARWGRGASGLALAPFRSLAVDPDVIPLGTPLYIEELDGKTLPGLLPFPHDGCVLADDRGDKIKGARIDWFIGTDLAYRVLDPMLHLETVSLHDGGARCADRVH